MWRAAASERVQGDAIARWVRRHPEGARLRAGLEANDLALEQVIARVRRDRPDATSADVLAYIRRLQAGS